MQSINVDYLTAFTLKATEMISLKWKKNHNNNKNHVYVTNFSYCCWHSPDSSLQYFYQILQRPCPASLQWSVTASKVCLATHLHDRLVHGKTQKEGILKSRQQGPNIAMNVGSQSLLIYTVTTIHIYWLNYIFKTTRSLLVHSLIKPLDLFQIKWFGLAKLQAFLFISVKV